MSAQYEINSNMRGSGFKFNEMAGETLLEHKLVYRGADGYWWLADASAAATMPTLGITMGRISANRKGEILWMGFIGDINWTWTAGDEIYASETAGELTQTMPTGAGAIVQVVAIANSNTVIQFQGNVAGAYGKPWDKTTESTYIIFTDGSLFYAKNGTTGQIDYNNASANTLINLAVTALPSGGHLILKPASYGDVTIDEPPTNLYIEGESLRGVDFTSLTITNAAGARANPLVIRDIKVNGTLSIERQSNVKLDSIIAYQLEFKAVWSCKVSQVNLYATPDNEYGYILTTSGAEYCTNCYFNRCLVADGGANSGAAFLDKSQTVTFDQLWVENMDVGIYLDNYAAFTEIRHSKIDVDGDGIIINESDNTIGPTWIDKNYIVGNSATYFYYGRSLTAQSGTKITDNVITSLATGATGIHLQGANYVTITGNTFRPTDLVADIVEAGSSNNNVIRNNQCPNGITVVGANTYGYEYFMKVSDPDSTIGDHPAVVLPDGVVTRVYEQLLMPVDMTSLVSVHAVIVPGGTGDFRREGASDWGIIGTDDYNTNSDAMAAGQIAVTADKVEAIDITALFTDIAKHCLAGFTFSRMGNSVNDTVNADCYYLGLRVRYV